MDLEVKHNFIRDVIRSDLQQNFSTGRSNYFSYKLRATLKT